jgi:hypothetical protein
MGYIPPGRNDIGSGNLAICAIVLRRDLERKITACIAKWVVIRRHARLLCLGRRAGSSQL